MAYDAHNNFAYSTVAVAPAPATTGLSLTVGTGQGALFPTAPFNCTVWPTGVNPLISNSEIIRVTAVVGDVLTIVRAQEGTVARSILVGDQIANTMTVKVFTDIENSIIQSISAGAGFATAPMVQFADANGVSFGALGNQITASVAGGGVAISADLFSQNTGTVEFSNSNGVSFGLDPFGVMTASVQANQTTQPVAASASNGSFLFSTLGFSNANNVTFGTSAGSIVTASIVPNVPQTTQPVAASASDGSFLFSTLGFSNANNVTFGTSAGSIITASVAANAGQSVQPVAASASNGSFLFSTVAFSNANNVTFGTSAGSIITASVAPPSAASINISAAGSSNDVTQIVFSNSNGVTFGLNGSTITASVGNASNAMLSFWENLDILPGGVASVGVVGASSMQILPILIPQDISLSFIRMPTFLTQSQTTIAGTSVNTSFTYLINYTTAAVLYTQMNGASSLSLGYYTSSFASWGSQLSITAGATGSHWTEGYDVTYPIEGSYSTLVITAAGSSSAYVFGTAIVGGLAGSRFVDIPFAVSLSAGNYWLGLGQSTSTASNAGPNCSNMRQSGFVFAYQQAQSTIAPLGPLPNTTHCLKPGLGFWSTNAAVMSTSSIRLADISITTSQPVPYIQMRRVA